MNRLNEAFASNVLDALWKQPFGKTTLLDIVRKRKQIPIDLNTIRDNQIQYFHKFSDAFKVTGKNVFKFWMHGSKIVGVTNSNSMFDAYGEVKRSKRYSIICCSEEFILAWESGRKAAALVAPQCYIFDFDALLATNNATKKAKDRSNMRNGALALMTQKEIKEGNIKRYADMLKQNRFSDGSEFALISNISNIITNIIKQSTATSFVYRHILDDSFFLHYMSGYSTMLVDYLELLNKSNYILPTNADVKIGIDNLDFDDPSNTDDVRSATKLRNSLVNAIEKITKYISGNKDYYMVYDKAIRSIVNNDKSFNDFIKLARDSGNATWDESKANNIVAAIKMLESDLLPAIQNKNISSDIMNFDALIMQFQGLYQQIRNNDANRALMDFVKIYGYWLNERDKPSLTDARFELNKFSDTVTRRMQVMIKMIRSI